MSGGFDANTHSGLGRRWNLERERRRLAERSKWISELHAYMLVAELFTKFGLDILETSNDIKGMPCARCRSSGCARDWRIERQGRVGHRPSRSSLESLITLPKLSGLPHEGYLLGQNEEPGLRKEKVGEGLEERKEKRIDSSPDSPRTRPRSATQPSTHLTLLPPSLREVRLGCHAG